MHKIVVPAHLGGSRATQGQHQYVLGGGASLIGGSWVARGGSGPELGASLDGPDGQRRGSGSQRVGAAGQGRTGIWLPTPVGNRYF